MRYLKKLSNIFNRKYKQNKIKPNDVFLVSYPKSGNSWLRFIVSNYLNKGAGIVDFHSVHDLFPEFETHLSDNYFRDVRFFKSHSGYNNSFRKVIYLVRDPRDVSVSYFYYSKKIKYIDKNMSFNDFLELFLKGDVPYGRWDSHVNGWLKNRNNLDDFLFIKYEDMLEEPFKLSKSVLEFAGFDVDSIRLEEAIENSSFSKLSMLEKNNQQTNKYLSNTDHSIPFIRKGIAGDYKRFFSEKMEADLLKRIATFGYIK